MWLRDIEIAIVSVDCVRDRTEWRFRPRVCKHWISKSWNRDEGEGEEEEEVELLC